MTTFAGMTEGGTFTPAPEGTHGARLLQVIDLGTQDGTFGPKRKMMVTFELTSKLMDDGKPYTITNWYTASLNRKGNLRKDLTSWLVRELTTDEILDFSWDTFANTPCLVTVTHHTNDKGDVKARVQSITAVPEGMEVAPLSGEPLFFDLEDYSDEVLSKISEGIVTMIQKSPEYQYVTSNAGPVSSMNTDPLPEI